MTGRCKAIFLHVNLIIKMIVWKIIRIMSVPFKCFDRIFTYQKVVVWKTNKTQGEINKPLTCLYLYKIAKITSFAHDFMKLWIRCNDRNWFSMMKWIFPLSSMNYCFDEKKPEIRRFSSMHSIIFQWLCSFCGVNRFPVMHCVLIWLENDRFTF